MHLACRVVIARKRAAACCILLCLLWATNFSAQSPTSALMPSMACPNVLQGINLASAFSQSAELPAGVPPSPAATHGPGAPSRQASLQPSPSSASQLSLPPSARSVDSAGGASDTSAFDHPPAYDPLAEEGVAGEVAAAAGSKRPRSRPPTAMQDTAVTNGPFGLSPLQSQVRLAV